jgi:hypothetical protein
VYSSTGDYIIVGQSKGGILSVLDARTLRFLDVAKVRMGMSRRVCFVVSVHGMYVRQHVKVPVAPAFAVLWVQHQHGHCMCLSLCRYQTTGECQG